jgi:hypothetical protein
MRMEASGVDNSTDRQTTPGKIGIDDLTELQQEVVALRRAANLMAGVIEIQQDRINELESRLHDH